MHRDAEDTALAGGGRHGAERCPGADALEPQSIRGVDRQCDLHIVADGGDRRTDNLAGQADLEGFSAPQFDGIRIVT